MKLLVTFVAAITVVLADLELDAMEKAGHDIMQRMHTHLGGEGENSLNTFLTNNDFVRGAVEMSRKERQDKIEEAVGSLGVTFVSVTRGNKQVNVTTLYGVAAGVVVNIRDRQRGSIGEEVEVPSQQEVDEITEPLSAKFVEEVMRPVRGNAGNATLVEIVDGGRRELNLRSKSNDLQVRAQGGFKVGAVTNVTRRG